MGRAVYVRVFAMPGPTPAIEQIRIIHISTVHASVCQMSATSDQGTHHHSAQHQAAATSHRDKGTIRLGEGETVVHSSSGAGDNLDAGMVIPAGFKRSVTRPRQHVRRRVEKPQVNTGGTPRKASARRQPRVTNPSSQQGKYNHDMRAATPVVMPPRNNENAPTATTGPGAEVKLAAATASIASTTRREPVTHEPVATAAGNAPESRDEMSTSICEIGYRSVLNAEETSAAAWRRLPQVCSRQYACANFSRNRIVQGAVTTYCCTPDMLLTFYLTTASACPLLPAGESVLFSSTKPRRANPCHIMREGGKRNNRCTWHGTVGLYEYPLSKHENTEPKNATAAPKLAHQCLSHVE